MPIELGVILAHLGVSRPQVLRRIVRLHAIGLITQVTAQQAKTGAQTSDDLISEGVLHRFRERINKDLEGKPVALEIEDHRQRLAELLATLGEKNFYELLELRPDAAPEDIHASYEALARLVHPRHCVLLSLQGKEPALELLFERATQAYLTLSDPKRRSAYERKMEINPLDDQDIDKEQRNRELAREYFQLARRLVDTQQYHSAFQLLSDAARRDPRPEYYALLAQVQSKNPNWMRQAVESYRRAHELAPRNAEVLLGLALICEQADWKAEAKEHFEGVLVLVPGHPAAEDGLARLQAQNPEEGARPSFWNRLLWWKNSDS